MIRTALLGAARSLFTVAILLGLAAALAGYGAYRLLRAATVGASPRARQAAAFGVLLALVELGRAMGATMPTPPTPPPPPAGGLEPTGAP